MRLRGSVQVLLAVAVLIGSLALYGCPKRPEVMQAAPAPAGPGWGPFNGPPATVAESSLAEMPRSITLPPASMTVYEFEVR